MYTKKNANLSRRGRSAQTAFLLHVVSYVAATGQNPTGHVSHLCDKRKCFNPVHLCDESATDNNRRKGCPGPIFCTAHGHCIVDLCEHRPRCIRPARDDVFCCLSIRESDPAGWASARDTPSSAPHPPSSPPPARARTATPAEAEADARADRLATFERQDSSEYQGAEWLEQAVAEGLI